MNTNPQELDSRLRIAAYKADLIKQLVILETHHKDVTDLEIAQVLLSIVYDGVRMLVKRECTVSTE